MPPHEVYIEPFLGGGAILRLKKPARLNIGIDLDLDPLVKFGAAGSASARVARFSDARRRSHLVKNGGAGLRLIHGDALEFLKAWEWAGNELVYCDPPYMLETRTSRSRYRCEMTAAQHQELLALIRQLPCKVMISGYWTETYAGQLADWHSRQYQAMTRGGTPRTEWLWSNFPEPVALHDYAWLGSNFRERQRIKRKKSRWVNRLERMPVLERQALLAAISSTAGFDEAAGT
jgi:hypothetical protein